MVDKAILYMNTHYGSKIYLCQLAGLMHLNEHYFCRLFKKETGITAMEYLIGYRIETAARLLEEENNKIIDIAFACGFENYNYFVRKFKYYKGCTPREFQRNKKEQKEGFNA